jgi:hypothetical protein
MRFKLLIILSFLIKFIFSQSDSSKAVVFIKPPDAIVYLDGKKIVPKKELITISVGYHSITAWAPNYELISDSFLVKKKENKFYSKALRYTDNYKDYKAKKRFRILTYTLPAVLAVGFGVTYKTRYTNFDKRINQTRNEALEIQNSYNTSFSPAEFQEYRQSYYQKVDDYNSLQNQQAKDRKLGIAFTSILGGTAVTVFIIQMIREKIPYK